MRKLAFGIVGGVLIASSMPQVPERVVVKHEWEGPAPPIVIDIRGLYNLENIAEAMVELRRAVAQLPDDFTVVIPDTYTGEVDVSGHVQHDGEVELEDER